MGCTLQGHHVTQEVQAEMMKCASSLRRSASVTTLSPALVCSPEPLFNPFQLCCHKILYYVPLTELFRIASASHSHILIMHAHYKFGHICACIRMM